MSRALSVTYATSTTASPLLPGDFLNQVQSVSTIVGASPPTVVATYKYDVFTGHLVAVTDPSNNLTTAYGYDPSSDRLASITQPGLTPTTYEYAGADNRLARVKRARPSGDPTGGTATLATVLYNVPVHGTAVLPDLTANTVNQWGQTVVPAYGAAVFGPDKPVEATLDPAQIASSDWASADLSYTDTRGYEINTASNGAGAWQYTDTEYDANVNPVRELDHGDIAAVLDGDLSSSDAGTLTVYNPEHNNTAGDVTLPGGSVVTDTYDTARYAVLGDGSRAWVRPHTHTDFDQSAPTSGIDASSGQEWALPTTVTDTAVDPATLQVNDTLSVTKTAYADAVPGDATAGWNLGLEGSSTQVMSGGTADITSRTRYDAQGRITSQWQPNSTGADAGTRQTIYYTAGTNPVAACGNMPTWDGAIWQAKYAAAPSSGPALSTTQTSLTGLSGSQSVPPLTYAYDSSTGLPIRTTASSGDPVNTGYDGWGRKTSYSAAAGETTTTGYDVSARCALVTGSMAVLSGGTATANRTSASATIAPRQAPLASVAHNRLGKATTRVVGSTANGRTVTGKFIPLTFSTQNGTVLVQGLLRGVVHNASGSTSTLSALRTMTVKTINGVPAEGTAPAANARVRCDILHLVLAPLDLNLLGLKVHLDRVVLNIDAVPGPGNLLGNLLCAVAGLLDGGLGGVLGQLVDVLNQILGALRLGV